VNAIWKCAIAALAISMSTAQSASAWIHDVDADKVDDRIERVRAQGISAAYEEGPVQSPRMAIAVFDGEPLTFGVYIGYDHHPTDADAAGLEALGIEVIRRYVYIDYIRSQVTAEQMDAITALPGVTRVEAIPMVYRLNHYGSRVVRARDATGLKKAENTALFPSVRGAYGIDGTGIVVAILDTGVNDEPDQLNPNFPGHESVAGKFLGGGNFYFGQPALNTALDASENPQDHGAEASSYHGTHVAGTAIGTGGQGNFFTGVAPAARLVDCKVLSDGGAGFGSADGVEWCIANMNNTWGLTGDDLIYSGIDVLSLSLGGTSSSDGTDASCQMMNAAVEAGLVVCIATGNDDSQNYIASPAAADLVISVGATDHAKSLTRADDLVTTFSNEGPRLDDGDADNFDEMKPSVAAPGANILSADGDPITGDGTGYKPLGGTSMSTPAVSGVCALVRQANPNLTPLEIRSIIQNTAEHFIPTAKAIQPANDPFGLDPNYNPACGWGSIDAYAAVKEALNSTSGVQVVQFRPVARPADLAVDVTWVTQREYAFQGFHVYRATDVSGAPGAFAQITPALVPQSVDGDPNIEGDDNRTPYVFVDADPALVLGQTYWYQVAWVAIDGTPNFEPAAPVDFGEPPRLATVFYSIAHDEPDTDLNISFGVSRAYDAESSDYLVVGDAKEAEQDSMVLLGPANAATATIGNENHFWSIGLSENDGVAPFLPPGNTGIPNPWFLNVIEGHFINRAGRITSFSVFVHDAPGSSSGTLYVTNSVLPAPTIEGQATTVWVPDRATPVESARLFTSSERGGVRVTAQLDDALTGSRVWVSRASSTDFAEREQLNRDALMAGGRTFEYLDTSAQAGVAYWYWIEFTDARGRTVIGGPVMGRALGSGGADATTAFSGPNPIRSQGTFEYTIGSDVAPEGNASILITVHDVQGRLVRTLKEGVEPAGHYAVDWNADDATGARVAAGTYFLRFSAGKLTRTSKHTIVR
jgi:subtilisin family serine protease